MREKILSKLGYLAVYKTRLMLFLILIFTILMTYLGSGLELKMSFKNMMPQSHKKVKEFDNIVNNYQSTSNVIIAAIGEENELKQFAEDIVPEIRKLSDDVKRVDYKLNREFFEKYAFLLTKSKDLKNMKDQFENLGILPFLTNLNNSFESTYIADSESISNKEKENKAINSLDGIDFWLDTMKEFLTNDTASQKIAETAVDRFLFGDEYSISQDKDMIIIFAQPTFSVNEVERSMALVNNIDDIIEKAQTKYPSIEAGTSGTMALMRDETEHAYNDMSYTSIISFLLIIALFIVSFRMWVAPLLAGITLIVGVLWTAGFAELTVGSLNMMTSMFAVVLMGLGIDFSIHIITSFTENRASGLSLEQSMKNVFYYSGTGVVVGAVTTALAFLTMLISKNAGMKEFGLIAGSGVIFSMISALIVLPSLLVVRDRLRNKYKKVNKIRNSASFPILGQSAEYISKKPIRFILFSLLLTSIFLYFALQITFNYDYLSLEPKGLTSIKLQDRMIEEFDTSPDMVMITTDTIEEARSITEQTKDLEMIGMVSSISDYVPSEEEQAKRLPYIRNMKKQLENKKNLSNLKIDEIDYLIDELYRVEDNIIEMAQLAFTGGQDRIDLKTQSIIGDLEQPAKERNSKIINLVKLIEKNPKISITRLQKFQNFYEPYMRKLALGMTRGESITLDELPDNIRSRFENENKDKFLISIYPKEQVWDFKFLAGFNKRMNKIDERVTGMPLIFYVLVTFIGKDGRLAAGLTILVVMLILYFDFKKIKLTLIAMVPLVFGVIWMLGLMKILGMQLNIMNTIGVPLILGMGIDDGVHIIHRYLKEDKGQIKKVFSSTGKAVLLTSLTTMLAFGSMGFATMRGLASLGLTLLIGIATCFLTSVLVLPAMLGRLDK